MRKLIVPLLALVVASPLVFGQMNDQKMEWKEPPPMKIDVNKKYTATLDTTKGKIVLELFAKEAPKTVNSFVFLAREGFYNGTEFHRVIPGFMIQGGDRNGNPKGTGDAGYKYENENKETTRKYEPGTVGMANSGPDTNGSQFFIMDAANPLPARSYTIFGQLKDGQDVVHAIATVERDARDKPRDPVVLKTVTISEE
jgi:cyclophilin family peptidyl-prolyl cis-trans isomerase